MKGIVDSQIAEEPAWNVDISGGIKPFGYQRSYFLFNSGTLNISDCRLFSLPYASNQTKAKAIATLVGEEFWRWLRSMGSENDTSWDQISSSNFNTQGLFTEFPYQFGGLSYPNVTDIDDTSYGYPASEFFIIPVAWNYNYIYYTTAGYTLAENTYTSNVPIYGLVRPFFYNGSEYNLDPQNAVPTAPSGNATRSYPINVSWYSSLQPTSSKSIWLPVTIRKRV